MRHVLQTTVSGGYNGGAVISVKLDGTEVFNAVGSSPYNLAYTPAAGTFTADGETVNISITPPPNSTSMLTIAFTGYISRSLSVQHEGNNTSWGYNYSDTYEFGTEPANGEIKAGKVLTGRDWQNADTFTFTIEALNGAPVPQRSSVTVSKNTYGHSASFGNITFTEAGTYQYRVQETPGSIEGITYDDTVHTITIKLKEDGSGHLIGDGTELIQTAVFTNTYTAPGMALYLYSNHSEQNRLNKEITGQHVAAGALRNISSVINPVIRVNIPAGDFIRNKYNYLYIPAWGRWYFITDAVSIRTGITELTCRVDVLQSFKEDIENLTVITDKQKQNGSVYINDGSWISEEREFYTIKNFQNGFNDSGEYILITAGA